MIGSRVAWQHTNLKGGIHEAKINRSALEVERTPKRLRAVLAALKENPYCDVLSGTFGETLASQLTVELQYNAFPIAHAEPWLQCSKQNVGDCKFPIFTARKEQLSHALKSIATMGIMEVGGICGSVAMAR